MSPSDKAVRFSGAKTQEIAELLDGKGIDYPHMSNVTFKRAPRAESPQPEQLTLAASSETPKSRRKSRK